MVAGLFYRVMEQYKLQFRAPNGIMSACLITIYPDLSLVIASETDEGMSVTNAVETIATEVVRRYGIDPKRMLFVEHYPPEQRPQPWGESYDLVTFSWDGTTARNPDWRPLSPAEFQDILRTVER